MSNDFNLDDIIINDDIDTILLNNKDDVKIE